MPHLAQDRLALVRRLYEDSELTIAEIAILAEVSESAIYQRARREQWVNTRRPGVTPRKQKLRPPLPLTPALKALAGETDGGAPEREALAPTLARTTSDVSDVAANGGEAGIARLRGRERECAGEGGGAFPDVDRAETARRLWLAVNRHLDDLDTHGAPDSMVRAAQNFAALARTLKTLVGIEREVAQERQAQTPWPDEGPADIDEFRNEIARRLEAMLGIPPGGGADAHEGNGPQPASQGRWPAGGDAGG